VTRWDWMRKEKRAQDRETSDGMVATVCCQAAGCERKKLTRNGNGGHAARVTWSFDDSEAVRILKQVVATDKVCNLVPCKDGTCCRLRAGNGPRNRLRKSSEFEPARPRVASVYARPCTCLSYRASCLSLLPSFPSRLDSSPPVSST